jgi:hypothetical protein
MIVYASAAAYARCGLPTCGCGERMTLANLRDVAVVEPESLDRLGERDFNAAMRELGYVDMIRAKAPPRRIAQPQCAEPGCSRFRKYGDRWCVDHLEAHALPF